LQKIPALPAHAVNLTSPPEPLGSAIWTKSAIHRYWCVVLPALAGIAGGIWLTPRAPSVANADTDPFRLDGGQATVSLPDDPEILKLAAVAGRTHESRLKINDLLAAGAWDTEIAVWLAPILFADPGWLERFILTVPEERRISLVRAAFAELGKLHPDAVWELIGASPFAAMAARSRESDEEYPRLSLSIAYAGSPLAAETLFDPANGFSDEEIARYFRWGGQSAKNSRRILDEWLGGRWPGDPPECIRSAWADLLHQDKDSLQELRGKIPEELQAVADRLDALAALMDTDEPITTDPDPAALRLLGPEELASFAEERAIAARPIPLASLAELPPELREPVIERFFEWMYPFQAGLARQAIEELDLHGFSDEEKRSLLMSAAIHERYHHGDYETALEWAGRIGDPAVRGKFEREMLEDWVRQDPHGALDYAADLPPGPLREDIERQAREAMP
jgi:hypothetical protein